MPPFIPRKRRHSSPPVDAPAPKSAKKESLFDTVDKSEVSGSLNENRIFLQKLDDADTDSSLSDVSSSEFEGSHASKRHKPSRYDDENADEEAEEVAEWEDAIHQNTTQPTNSTKAPSANLELTLNRDAQIGSLTKSNDKKKGPGKIERQIRVSTHCMHVQFLLFHNLIRNAWACDVEVQSILVGQLPPGIEREVEKWRRSSGISPQPDSEKSQASHKNRGGKQDDKNERSQRDWGKPAERLESGTPNMSRGDPLIRLLKVLASYWKKRFTITAPGLRKQGYRTLAQLEAEIASFKSGSHDPEIHGERLSNLHDFRNRAKSCEGSKDVGAQLFTALIRGMGINARLVASLQPIGFGWGKGEEATSRRRKDSGVLGSEADDDSSPSDVDVSMNITESENMPTVQSKSLKSSQQILGRTGRPRGKVIAAHLSEGDDRACIDSSTAVDDVVSVIDIAPAKTPKRSNKHYDRDMAFPTYWTEVVSPITYEVYPVDSLTLTPAVATNQEHLALYESRGVKADKAKQVFAYVIAFSSDGTAKDVTTRYLRRHMWPGRTKGVRLPVEKVPVYNRKGKIKHEDYDWFKTVMSGYMRTNDMRTAVDDLEEAKDLKALKPEKKEAKHVGETLQSYKTSAEFVLERHLRREEAILPGSTPLKMFLAGKGDKAKEEPVYRRKDVTICRTSESWHKEGRQVKAGEHPIKMVPIRAVTLTRKREVEEAEREGGEKMKQGLYAWDQTDWIIPPPIENGVIPKNSFGNMDCFVPTMIPKGAVHIPLRSTTKICKRLGIDFAEACIGFEFGNQRAIPILTGVVVAAEHENLVIDEWEKDEEERKVKEEYKREKVALAAWKKMLIGLRIMKRVNEEYGGDADAHMKEVINPFTNKKKQVNSWQEQEPPENEDGNTNWLPDGDMAGGFLVDDTNELGSVSGRGGVLLDEASHDRAELVVESQQRFSTDQKSPSSSSISIPAISETTLSSRNGDSPCSDDSEQIRQRKGRRKRPQSKGTNKCSPLERVPGPAPLLKRSRLRRQPKEPTTRKAAKNSTDAEPSSLPAPASRTGKSTPRAVPKRKAARASENAVRSHYFALSSDDDDYDDDAGERGHLARGAGIMTPRTKKPRGRPVRDGKSRS